MIGAEFKLTDEQITNILDKLVPLIAEPEDYGFFRGVLYIRLANTSSSDAAAFIANLLKEAERINTPV